MSHEEGNGSCIDEGITDFVQLFEIGTQSLVGLRSCPAGDGEGISLFGTLDFLGFHALDLEAGGVKSLTNSAASQFSSFFDGDKRGCAREHYLVDAFHLLQGQTGLVSSASTSTAEGY